MWQLTIEATEAKDEGGMMPRYSIDRAPTWALEESLRAIQKELDARARIVFLMREDARRLERERRSQGS